MGRPTIADLRRVFNQGVPSHINAEPWIESDIDAHVEDLKRDRMLSDAAGQLRGEGDNDLFWSVLELSDRLLDRKAESPASALYMWDWRIAATEQLWRLVEETGPENCFTFTAISPSWIRTQEELEHTTTHQLTEAFRSLLNRHGAGEAKGWLLAKVDDEFDMRNQLHRLHYHGIASAEMLEVVDSLRDSGLFRAQRTPAIEGRRVVRPLHIDRRPLTNLPMPLSYILKGHFSARWLGYGSDGKVKRGRHPCRIPEPFGTRTLVWLDQQSLAEMFVMFGLAIREGQLVTRG